MATNQPELFRQMDTKKQIVERAETLFLSFGIRSVTMDDIASEIGISKKTVYQFFDKKEELVKEVVVGYLQREKEMALAIQSTAKDALDEMRMLGQFIMGMIENISPSALFDLQKYHRASWELMMQKQNEHDIDLIIENIKKGIEEGLYRTDFEPEIVAKIFAKSSHMVVNELSDRNSKFSKKQLIKELYEYHVNGISTPKGKALWKEYSKAL